MPYSSDSCPICAAENSSVKAGEIVFSAGIIKEARQCSDCESYYLYPAPNPAEIGQVYHPQYFRDFFENYWKDIYRGKVIGGKLSKLRATGNYLDVGCAIGSMLTEIKETCDWQVFGIELDPTAAEYARKRGLVIFSQPLEQLPLEANFFDYIFANNVIEHIPRPQSFFETIRRVLKPGGILHLATPNGAIDIYPSLKLALALNPLPTRHAGHVNFFTKKGLVKIAQANGFEITSLKEFHFKTALKQKLFWPGSQKKILKELNRSRQSLPQPELDLSSYERLIPPRPPGWYLLTRAWWKSLCKALPLPVGADFDVRLRKL